MKEKYLYVTMPDGVEWEIPVSVIAQNRAKYYADQEGDGGNNEAVYREEYEHTLKNDYEIIDWAENNMDWNDVEPHAKLSVTYDEDEYQEHWTKGRGKRIIEVEVEEEIEEQQEVTREEIQS